MMAELPRHDAEAWLLGEKVWAALVDRCAATPDKTQVRRLVMVSHADIIRAVKDAVQK